MHHGKPKEKKCQGGAWKVTGKRRIKQAPDQQSDGWQDRCDEPHIFVFAKKEEAEGKQPEDQDWCGFPEEAVEPGTSLTGEGLPQDQQDREDAVVRRYAIDQDVRQVSCDSPQGEDRTSAIHE